MTKIKDWNDAHNAGISARETADAVWAKAKNGHHHDADAPAFSDEALALKFAKQHAGDLRYVARWGKWLTYDGQRWQPDHTLRAYDLARQVCREVAAGVVKARIAAAVASAKTVAAIERLAKADRRLAATTEQWDGDPWLLNTPRGVVDLRSGKTRQHDPTDFLMQMTAVAPGGGCPQWLAFLDRVTGGDDTLREFLKRVCGYALTGSTRDHALFFGFGTGANGKTTFLNTIAGAMGDYHRTAPIETFTASISERHPTDLAGLVGARLVTATETEEGRRWAESKIKALTGGDKISARFMRQDFFEFTPQFKLMIGGNYKPGLRSVDEAIRRRFHLIPFSITIPPDERDETLSEKLKAEWPGILAWMIQGCADWLQQGLAPPEAVQAATAAYMEGQDAVAAWMDERCERRPNAWERSALLFASWKAWAEQSGEAPGNAKSFRSWMESRGVFYKREPGTGQRGYEGIKLKPGFDGTTGGHLL